MQALADALHPLVRDALAPIPVETVRSAAAPVPSAWLRPPTSSPASGIARIDRIGLLYLDLWAESPGDLDDMCGRVAFVDGLVIADAVGRRVSALRYREASDTRVQEEDATHAAILYEVLYADVKRVAKLA